MLKVMILSLFFVGFTGIEAQAASDSCDSKILKQLKALPKYKNEELQVLGSRVVKSGEDYDAGNQDYTNDSGRDVLVVYLHRFIMGEPFYFAVLAEVDSCKLI